MRRRLKPRLHKRNPPPWVEEKRRKVDGGFNRVYTGETHLRGLNIKEVFFILRRNKKQLPCLLAVQSRPQLALDLVLLETDV